MSEEELQFTPPEIIKIVNQAAATLIPTKSLMVLMGIGGIVMVIFLHIFSIARCFQYDCTRTEYNKCVRIADPLVRDMHLVFPDNLDDIDTVCRTWNRFIDCLQTYTDKCFTADQRKQFNNAVKNPIDSVHQMCVRSDYQRDQICPFPKAKPRKEERNRGRKRGKSMIATDTPEKKELEEKERKRNEKKVKTLKKKVFEESSDEEVEEVITKDSSSEWEETEENHEARTSVEDAAEGDFIVVKYITNITFSSHDRFKKCIESETRNLCDNGRTGGPASKFSTQIVGKALSFLQDECVNYIPNSDSGDCTISLPKKDGPVIESIIPAAPSEIYPWSTIHDISSREPSTKIQPSRTTTAWLPSSTYYHPTSNSDSSVPDVLGARTRPSSYGRSSGWTDYSTQNTQPSFNNMFSETVTSPKPEWGTISTWSVLNQQPSSLGTSTTNDEDPNKSFTFGQNPVTESSIKKWYPAAGSQVENEVDEPNQQGLIKPKNNAGRAVTCTVSIILTSLILKLC
ncbi:hypothetical protein MML48_9g00004700 [Holotrichia oblita]|uniref:Uncharacterized protein n=1 Tax=Holotrichia oblita TaxID=644536 RepID=A0ACB9SGZ4_HOLOL|nr:hypothetical protein MML48_9g00004700 [Holotrichia oblita]